MSTTAPPPPLEAHFLPASLLGLIRRGHPYDFADTYRSLAVLYGYKAAYVNLGLWGDGPATEEPGRALTFAVAAPLRLSPGETLVDVGSGLGQGALDLATALDLGQVIGVNPNLRQLGYARALAAAAGASARVRHEEGDATTWFDGVSPGTLHGVIAVECVGHFPDPDAFLRGARRALAPGRELAFCLNIAKEPPGWVERVVFQTAFGFVPSPLATWTKRLEDAGFVTIQTEDWTDRVTGALCGIVAERLARGGPDLASLSWSARFVARILQFFTSRAIREERLGYALIHAAAPAERP